jgi:undecaprenyl pyrophosphate phosphatase UppP
MKRILQKANLLPLNKKAAKRSFLAACSRLIGVMMAAGSGSLLYQAVGSSTSLAVGVAISMSVIGLLLIWFLEYERETEQ